MWHDARFWFWAAGIWIVAMGTGMVLGPALCVWYAGRLRKRIARKAHKQAGR